MSLRDTGKELKYDPENPPPYVKNPEGRIFPATPQLLDKEDMEPCYSLDGNVDVQGLKPTSRKEINVAHSNKKTIAKRIRENFGIEVNPNDYEVNEIRALFLGLQDKQQLINSAEERFGVKMNIEDDIEALKERYATLEVENASNQDN